MIEKYFSADIAPALAIRPPAPRHEVVGEPRPGYIWVTGYWDWRDNRHAWVGGYWMAERRGYRWHDHRWVQREGQWYLQYGGWAPELTPALMVAQPARL